MGFTLCQQHNGTQAIIKCGLKSFTPTQQRYATIELECLTIIWAIQKCEFFLKGLPTFTVATDHRPLVGTFSKNLAELTNPRLLRLREKVSGYCFKMTYVPGKTRNIADALSRAPIFPGSDKLDIRIDTALAYLVATKDPALNMVHESINHDYQQCITDIIEDTVTSGLSQQLKSIKGDNSVRSFPLHVEHLMGCLLYTSPSPRDS